MTHPIAFTFNIPTRIVFHRGALSDLTDIAEVRGRRCQVFSFPAFDVTPITAQIAKSAAAVELVDAFEENPSDALARSLAQRAREFGAEVLLAIGGGSTIDLAKAVAWFDANSDSGINGTPDPRPVRMDIVAVPTTAGTGSEVSPFTVMTDAESHAKWFVKHMSILPRVALLDPELTVTVPRNVTAHTGIDALSHAVEGYLSKNCGGMLEPIALDACKRVRDALPTALERPDDIEARESLLLGSLEGGLILSTCGTVFVHALGYRLTARFGYAHGRANALMLGEFVERMASLGSERARWVLDMFDGDLSGFIRECGVKPDVALTDIPNDEIEDWTDSGWNAYGRPGAVVPVNREDVQAVLRSAFA